MSEQQVVNPLVITAGDEGVQLNVGTRLGFIGSGFALPGFVAAIKVLKKIFKKRNLVLVSIQEDDWLAEKLQTHNPNLYQETVAKVAKENKLIYVGQLDYGDPRDLEDGLTRGHLVRPPKIHVADRIIFTIGGGEQNFNLRKIVLSADYLFALSEAEAEEIITTQVEFYRQLLKKPLKFEIEEAGELEAEIKAKNKTILEKILQKLA